MRINQPNFQKICREIFNLSKKGNNTQIFILMDRVINPTLALSKSFHKRETDFFIEFEKTLDKADIRNVGQMIDDVIKLGGTLPSWIKNKDFSIDYNNKGMLDLIRNIQ